MAYIDNELENFRIIWRTVADRVLVTGLILAGMGLAAGLSVYMGYAPHEIVPPR